MGNIKLWLRTLVLLLAFMFASCNNNPVVNNNGGNDDNNTSTDNIWLMSKMVYYDVQNGYAGVVSYEIKQNWNYYSSETNYSSSSNYLINYDTVQNNENYYYSYKGSATVSSNGNRYDQTLNQTSNTYSDITTTVSYKNVALPDIVTRTIEETKYDYTLYYDFSSGLVSRQVMNGTISTRTNNSTPVVTTSNSDIYWKIELQSDSGSVRTYKYYATENAGAYSIYKISNGNTIEQNLYSADNILISTITYSSPNNSSILSKLPKFSLVSTTNYTTNPITKSDSTYEVLRDSSTELAIRIKTYTNNVLSGQVDYYYEKYNR